jgi:hypothetical protein
MQGEWVRDTVQVTAATYPACPDVVFYSSPSQTFSRLQESRRNREDLDCLLCPQMFQGSIEERIADMLGCR